VSAAVTRPIRVLLVEDNPADVRLTREAFKDWRLLMDLDVAVDGVDAMAYLRREPPYTDAAAPDIVLLDLNLPRMDGREVLAEMKSDPALRHIPVAVLTTSTADADIFRSYDLHANCYIAKPVDFGDFVRVVAALGDFWFTIVRLPTMVGSRV
jgi:CheY-like chemotaxis protein